MKSKGITKYYYKYILTYSNVQGKKWEIEELKVKHRLS